MSLYDVEDINKSCMESSITDYGKIPFAYGIATMNLSGVSKPEVSKATERRKKVLNLILLNTQRDIILFQECKWTNPLRHINTNYLDNYIIRGDGEAGIIWNSKVFDVEDISIKTLYSNTIEYFPKLKLNRGRLFIGTAKYKKEEEEQRVEDYKDHFGEVPKLLVHRFIIMSWHGPCKINKDEKKEKKVIGEKKDILKQLIEFCEKMFIDNPEYR